MIRLKWILDLVITTWIRLLLACWMYGVRIDEVRYSVGTVTVYCFT